MNILIIGGAGHVGSIIRPALEAEHDVRYFDLKPVPGAEDRTTVGDMNDQAAVARAMDGRESVINLALGVRPGTVKDVSDIALAFKVHVQGCYTTLCAAAWTGMKQYIYASSMSVYDTLTGRVGVVDEMTTPDTFFNTYGMSKFMGEQICRQAGQRMPHTNIQAIRLFWPMDEAAWEKAPGGGGSPRWAATGPKDSRRLFLAALQFREPGFHLIQATGDVTDSVYPHDMAREKLNWEPRGE